MSKNDDDEIFIDHFVGDDGKVYGIYMSMSSLFALPLSKDNKVTLIIEENKEQSHDIEARTSSRIDCL